MKKSFAEIVIRVNDLNCCRIFYRETLQLGDPVVDSDFIASFKVSDTTLLTLEKTDAPFLEHASSAMTWRFCTDDLEGLRNRIRYAGSELMEDPCGGYWRGTDPEGNVFLVRRGDDDELMTTPPADATDNH